MIDSLLNQVAKENILRQLSGIAKLFEIVESPEHLELMEYLTSFVSESKDYSKRLILTGVGKNANIAAKISETMASLGIPSFYLNTAHASHGDFGFIGPNDCVIHISKSGKTLELLNTIKYIRKSLSPNIKQVLIHCNPLLENNDFCDFEICLGSIVEGDYNRVAPTTSTTTLLCYLDSISVSLAKFNDFKSKDFLRYHPGGSLGEELSK